MAITNQLMVLRQASARAWRIGQTKTCKTIFLYYSETAQQSAISLMARKLMAAEYLEGNLEGGGLQDEDDEARVELAIVKQMAEGMAGHVPKSMSTV